ncbi:zinc finger, CCHC-type containing protein [Tanacetum coccineum]
MATAAMSVVYVLTTPIPEDGGDDPTMKHVMKRNKWDNDDYVCRGLILKGMSDLLFDIQQIVESRKELWDSLEAKYMAEDASSKKFLVSNFTNYKITDSRPVMEQHNELFDFKHTLNHKKEELTLVELGSCDNHGLIRLNIVNNIGKLAFMSTFKLNDSIIWFCYVSLLHTKDEALDKLKVFKTKVELQQGSLIKRFRTNMGGLSEGFWGEAMAVVRLPDLKLKTLGESGIECIFVGYAEHSKDFRFYVIEPNDSDLINSIIKSRDAIFDENRFSSVPRPSLRIPNGTEDIGDSVVPEEVTKEVVQQPEPELRKSKRNRTPKDFRPEFQLYLVEGTRDEVSDQHSYCFNVEYNPKTFDEAIKSKDVTFRKEAINDEMDSIMGKAGYQGFKQQSGIDYFDTYAPVARISTIRLLIAMASIHNLIIHQMDEADVILGIRIKHESNGIAISQSHYIEKVLKKFNYFDCTPVSTPMDTSEKLMPNNGQVISQLEYSRVIGYLMYAMTCTRPDIAFVVGKLSRYTSNPGTQHWQAIQRVLKYLKKTMDYRLAYTCYPSMLEGYTNAIWISNTEDNSSTSGWEVEWLKNLLLEIPLWVKPIASISIRCDSAATLAKAYSQMYNEKSRHLGVRHSMIRKLITNGLISIEFVRSQQNLADHLTKGLARDLVTKSAEGMGLKSN